MRITQEDGYTYITFEKGDSPIQVKEDGTYWWSNGRGLKLQFHFYRDDNTEKTHTMCSTMDWKKFYKFCTRWGLKERGGKVND